MERRIQTIHIYPINDLEEHNTDNKIYCKCNPKSEIYTSGVLIIHNRLNKVKEIIKEINFNLN